MDLLVFFILTVLADFSWGKCIWYDQCGISPDTNKALNCKYEGEPKPLENSDQLWSLCPGLSGVSEVCCSPDQVVELKDSFFLAEAVLGRCPSCLHNFKAVFCQMSCGPNQSDFLTVTRSLKQNVSHHNPSGADLVAEVTFRLSEDTAVGVYESCKDVISPATTGTVLDLMCGPWGSQLCTPRRLYKFLGDTANGNIPFNVNFEFVSKEDLNRTSSALDTSVVPCSVAPSDDSASCSCADCTAACTTSDLVSQEEASREEIEMAHQAYGAGVGITAVLALITMVFLFTWRSKKSRIYPTNPGAPGPPGTSSPWWSKSLLDTQTPQEEMFKCLGRFCATYPWTVLLSCLVLVCACAGGAAFTKVTTNPIELWSSKNSKSRMEKDFFDKTFGKFYRVEQVIVTAKESSSLAPFEYTDLLDESHIFSPIFRPEFMLEVLKLQKAIEDDVKSEEGIRLKDVCHQPLAPESDACNVQSIWAYWQENSTEFMKSEVNKQTGHNDTYLDHLILCARNPIMGEAPTSMGQGCLSSGGIPVQPLYALGGVAANNPVYSNATAFVLTFLVLSDESLESKAQSWESAFLKFMQDYKDNKMPDTMDVSFNTERSIEDEIKSESFGDVHIIVLSYSVMLVYIVSFLGRVTSCSLLPVQMKFTLGASGTFSVLLAVVAAVGVYGYIGVPTTLVVFQILPFLVLAVGVDNIFIMVSTLDRVCRTNDFVDENSKAIDMVSRTLALVGPSILLSTCAQATAFFLGSMSSMPAVQAFSLYAALSLIFNFLLQVTALVAVMTLDLRRMIDGRVDLLCCVKLKKEEEKVRKPLLQRFFAKHYTPVLLSTKGKRIVLVVFLAWSAVSAVLLSHLSVGLETESALPDGSNTLKYIKDLKKHLSVGPPVYFVVNNTGNFDYTDLRVQNLVCGGRGCNPDSLQAQIKQWSSLPNITYLATPAQSWIDDYFDWIRTCCKKTKQTGKFCSKEFLALNNNSSSSDYGDYGDYGEYSVDEDEDSDECVACVKFPTRLRPSAEEFRSALPWFVQENPDRSCPKAGKAAYANSIAMREVDNSYEVTASAFFTFHSVLRSSSDFSESMRWAYKLAENLTATLNAGVEEQVVNVFPYSFYYVFYEQYLSIAWDGALALGVALCSVFVVVLVLTGGCAAAAGLTLVTVALTALNVGGAMAPLGIEFNAISVVNLVMTVGISVEFCSHLIAAAFAPSKDSKDKEEDENHGRSGRAGRILNEWGGVLLSGVHVTNLLGVAVLALANSRIFHVYYFRMYMAVVITGALHGLVLLPVLIDVIVAAEV